MMEEKKPVGVAIHGSVIVVVCNDGSVWYSAHPTHDWQAGRPVPGSAAAESDVVQTPFR